MDPDANLREQRGIARAIQKVLEDSDYPGFTLYLDGEQVGVFEYDSFKEAVRIHVWNKPGADTDPVAQITIAPAV